MAVSKVVLGNQTVMDITDSNVDAGSLLAGKKAYGANGEAIHGSLIVSDRIRWNEAKTSVKKNLIKKSTIDYIKSVNTNGTWSENTFVKNGITWTINNDGTISATGTASSDSFLYLSAQSNIAFSLESGDYIITGCPNEGSTSKYRVEYAFFASGESNIYSRDTGEPVQVTLPQEREAQVICYISNGYAISEPLVFKPMIRLASIEDDTYVPYIPDNVELDSKKADVSSLATVATSGSYNDLSNKPTIPSATEVVFATGSFVSSTSDATTITATNSSIDLPSGATVEVCADVYNYPCSDVSTSGSGTSATITAVFPKDSVSRTINYKIYAKTI